MSFENQQSKLSRGELAAAIAVGLTIISLLLTPKGKDRFSSIDSMVPRPVRLPNNSFITQAPVVVEAPQSPVLPQIPAQVEQAVQPTLPPKKVSSSYTVKEGDTFSEIIANIFGSDEAYGQHFRDTILNNADLLSKKNPAITEAINTLKTTDWTPRTSYESWEVYMRIARLINTDDTINF